MKPHEKKHFIDNCEIKLKGNSYSSKYYEIKYKDNAYKFCISDHHSKKRGLIPTIISKDTSKKHAIQIAIDIHCNKKDYFDIDPLGSIL